MSLEILQAMQAAIVEAPQSGIRGIIISGQNGSFSSGIDLFTLLRAKPDYIEQYWQAVFGLAYSMAQCPIPIISAISGHCMASGALIAVFSDYRIMAEGNWNFGFTEVQAGIVLPECFQLALRRLVGPHQTMRLLMLGELLKPAQALNIGVVDELCPVDELNVTAIERLDTFLTLPETAFLEIRQMNKADLHQQFRSQEDLPIKAFVESFLAPDVQQQLQRLAVDLLTRLQRRRAVTF
ncbi:enoyl-CoA hydratase/isomerase family protein [Ectopseudomonas mendocina]|uniref:Enoyl-CoA hydratase/isomerase family protein n=1 Tax=Ectopseudomonas mendocina TaxID=300 RepID=A0ABZ2RFV6_ECTME